MADGSSIINNQRGFSNILGILVIAVITVVVAFSLGMRYEKSKLQKIDEPQNAKSASQQTLPEEDLEERCGKLPSEAYPNTSGGLSEVKGPYWSPDCRYAASSLEVVPRGYPLGVDVQGIINSLPLGIYLYTDATKNLTRISKEVAVPEWQDRENFIFKVENKKYQYNVVDKKVSPVDY